MPTHPLADLAWKVADLLRLPSAKTFLFGQRSKYLREREENPDRPSPLNWPDVLTLAEKCATLLALHSIVCTGEERFQPAPWPGGRTTEQVIEELGFQTAMDGMRWVTLVANVEEKLRAEHRDHVEAWLRDVEVALQELNGGPRRRSERPRGRPRRTEERKRQLLELEASWRRFYDEGSWKEHKADGTAKEQFCEQFESTSEDLESAIRYRREHEREERQQ